jgi:hypothetical protein
MHGHAVKLRLPQLAAGLDLLAHYQREAFDDHSALIGRSAHLQLDFLDGTAEFQQQLALRRQGPLEVGDRAELLDQLAQYAAEGMQIVELGSQAVERFTNSAELIAGQWRRYWDRSWMLIGWDVAGRGSAAGAMTIGLSARQKLPVRCAFQGFQGGAPALGGQGG